MQQNHLWYQDLPSYDDVNLFLEPASVLSKVKSKNDSYSFVDSVDGDSATYFMDLIIHWLEVRISIQLIML